MNPLRFLACSVCFGDPGSLQSKAVATGVLVLLGVVAFVLGGVAVTLISWIRRSRKLQSAP